MPNAIDLSFSALDVGAIPASVSLVIQNVWTGLTIPAIAEPNIDAATRAGKRVAAYAVVNPHAATPLPARGALEFIAVDCELYDDLTPMHVRAASDAIYAYSGWPRVIYTSRGYWQSVLGDDSSFAADHLLWDARPGDNLPFVPYGGWTEDRVIGVQRTSTVPMGTSEVDENDFRMELLHMPNSDGTPTAIEKSVASLEARSQVAGAILRNDMDTAIALLTYFGVIPTGSFALKKAI